MTLECCASSHGEPRHARKERGGMKGRRRRRAIFIHVGALLHETIRNNRGGITTAPRFASGIDRADRINSSAGTFRLDLTAPLSPPPLLPSLSARSTRREGVEAPFIFPLSFFEGPPPSISDNRLSPAARGKGIARIPDRIPNAAPCATDAGAFFYSRLRLLRETPWGSGEIILNL